MKICMIGLGSIGKRHLINICNILKGRNISYSIDALRSNKRTLPNEIKSYIENEYYVCDELPNDYDIIFITNPTSKHYNTIEAVSSKTNAIFIEKPIFENTGYTLQNLGLKANGVYYVACPMRHKSIFDYFKHTILLNEKIYAIRSISTSYLPEWRPNVDYRNVYSTQKEMGGGVTLDLIHEWDYLVYLFGLPLNVYNIHGKYSNLEMDCDDISVYIANYADKTVELHLDYIGRYPERKIELFCENYKINVDILNNRIEYLSNEECKDKKVFFEPEDPYVNEMNYFLDVVLGKKENINTIIQAYQVLEIALNKGEKE